MSYFFCKSVQKQNKTLNVWNKIHWYAQQSEDNYVFICQIFCSSSIINTSQASQTPPYLIFCSIPPLLLKNFLICMLQPFLLTLQNPSTADLKESRLLLPDISWAPDKQWHYCIFIFDIQKMNTNKYYLRFILFHSAEQGHWSSFGQHFGHYTQLEWIA